MNSYNGSTYDQLYPKTLLNNISDWNSNIYSKNEINEQHSQILGIISDLKPTSGKVITTLSLGLVTNKISSTQIQLPSSVVGYSLLCVRMISEENNIVLGANGYYMGLGASGSTQEFIATFFCFPINKFLFTIGTTDLIGANYVLIDNSGTVGGLTTMGSTQSYITAGGQSFSHGTNIAIEVYGY